MTSLSSRTRRAHGASGALIALAGAALLVGCSSDAEVTPPARSAATTSSPTSSATASSTPSPSDEPASSEHWTEEAGEACPATFTEGRDGDADEAVIEDFTAPSSTTPSNTWVCRYVLAESDDRWSSWALDSAPLRLEGENAALVTRLAESLTPPPSEQGCGADVAPRLLVSREVRDAVQAHMLIDLFGCGDVRLAEALWTDTLAWSAEPWSADRGVVDELTSLVEAHSPTSD